MKKTTSLVLLIIAGLVVIFIFWPIPSETPDALSLRRARLTVEIPAAFESKPASGLLSWLGIRGPARLARPDVGTAFTNITSTGFASSPYQTDSTPCRTASGALVRPGTVASNFLPLGTLLKIKVDGQELAGTFIVEDRMADHFRNRIDIWFAQTSQALDFGKRRVEITVVGYGKPGQSLVFSEDGEEVASAGAPTAWETVKLRARFIAEFLTTRGQNVNRFDVDCLKLQQAELDI